MALLNQKKHYHIIMKKFLTCYILLMFLLPALPCAAFDDDFWDEPIKVDNEAKSQQKAVTDQEFNKVLNFFTRKKKEKEEKKKPKGAPIGPQIPEGQMPSVDNTVIKNAKDDYSTVMIPVTLITRDGKEIEPGYYRILPVKSGNKIYYLNFYQGNQLIAKIPAYESATDHNQKSLNYAKVIPVEDRYMNVIYGDIDCNIEARVDIKQ